MYLDIISIVASFMPLADDLVYAIPTLYRLPYDTLERMNIVIIKMTVDHGCIDRCPAIILRAPPKKIDNIIESYPKIDELTKFIVSLPITNPPSHNLIDALRHANTTVNELGAVITYLRYDTRHYIIHMIHDCIAIINICQYDLVLHKYSENHRHVILPFIDRVFHGRSIWEMYLILRHDCVHVMQLIAMITDETMIESIVADMFETHGYVTIPRELPQAIQDKMYAKYWLVDVD